MGVRYRVSHLNSRSKWFIVDVDRLIQKIGTSGEHHLKLKDLQMISRIQSEPSKAKEGNTRGLKHTSTPRKEERVTRLRTDPSNEHQSHLEIVPCGIEEDEVQMDEDPDDAHNAGKTCSLVAPLLGVG